MVQTVFLIQAILGSLGKELPQALLFGTEAASTSPKDPEAKEFQAGGGGA